MTVSQSMTHACTIRPNGVHWHGDKWYISGHEDSWPITYCPWCGHQLEPQPVKAQP